MKISYQELLSRTQREIASPIYIFSGKDEFRKEKAVKKLKESLLKPGAGELSLSLFYGEESTGSDIIMAASTPTLTGDRQLIIVKNADKLKAPAKTIVKNYSHSPLTSTCLVLLVTKNDYGAGDEVVFTPPSEREAITWITREVREKGWNISPQAAFKLKEKVGIDTRALESEIEKLILYCWDKKNITPEDIEFLVGDSKEVVVFDITNAINNGNIKKALTMLKKFSDDEKRTLSVINAIVGQMRRLATAKTKIKRGEESAIVCREMKVPFFFQQEFISLVGILEWDKVKKSFYSILQAELDFKSGRSLPELGLELLTIGLCRDR